MVWQHLAWVPAMCAALVVLSATACSGDDGDDRLSDTERQELRAKLDALRETAGFSFVAPSYLPNGIGPIPGTQSVRSGEALIWFSRNDETETEGEISEVFVDQEYDPNGRLATDCAASAGSRTEFLNVDGKQVGSKLTEGGHGAVVQSLAFWASDRCVVVHMVWRLSAGLSQFADDMRNEGLKVVKSILDPGG